MAKPTGTSLLSAQEILNKCYDPASQTLDINLGQALAGEDLVNNVMKTEQRFTFANITASGCPAGNILSTARFLHSITFNQPVSNVTTVLTDSTAAGGTLIGTIKQQTGSVNPQPYTLIYNITLTNGLAASQVSPVATGSDMTVAYRP